MKIAIYSRGIENNQHNDMVSFLEELNKYKIEPVFFQDFFNQFYSAVDMKGKYSTFNSPADLDDRIDCIISLGGDGTLLDTITFVGDKGIPVLGINYGRLGFLASLGKEDLHSAIKALVERTYVLDERTLIHLDADIPVFKTVPYALNEFTLQKKDSSSMIKIHTYLNGEFLNIVLKFSIVIQKKI
jgi:NAD+ kinase